MALSGLGGDELFCGYAIFKQAMELNEKSWLNYVPRSIRLLAGNILRKKNGVASEKKAEVLALDEINFESFYPVSRKILPDREINKLLKKNGDGKNRVQEITSAIVKMFPYEDQELSRVSLAEMTTYMQNVLLRDTDQVSMAHALEVRVPFLDYKLVEYVLSLPDELKFPSSPKKLLVDACKDLLPEEIYNRKKMGFTFPWQRWMKNELRSFCENRMEILAKRDEFNEDAVRRLWQRFLDDDPKITWSRIWPLVVLAHWLEKNEISS